MLKNFFLTRNSIYILAVLLFSFGINFHYSHIGVNPMDNFVLYNGGYRVLNGYVPFSDYWLVTGPLLDYLNALFFLIGGVYMVFIFPAPLWFIVGDLVLAYIPMGWLGWKLSNK